MNKEIFKYETKMQEEKCAIEEFVKREEAAGRHVTTIMMVCRCKKCRKVYM